MFVFVFASVSLSVYSFCQSEEFKPKSAENASQSSVNLRSRCIPDPDLCICAGFMNWRLHPDDTRAVNVSVHIVPLIRFLIGVQFKAENASTGKLPPRTPRRMLSFSQIPQPTSFCYISQGTRLVIFNMLWWLNCLK